MWSEEKEEGKWNRRGGGLEGVWRGSGGSLEGQGMNGVGKKVEEVGGNVEARNCE